MTKPTQLVMYTVIIIIIAAITECLYPNTFFILTTFGFLFIIMLFLFLLRCNNNNRINLDSENHAHMQRIQTIGQHTIAIAHDFNNILTAILGYSHLLLQKYQEDNDLYQNVSYIKQNTKRAANLVKQLLSFSKKSEHEPININIEETINNLLPLINQLANPTTSVSIKHCQENIFTTMDISKFEQIIINLAINARDAMNQNGEIIISTSSVNINENFDTTQYFTPSNNINAKPGKYVLISISDTGTGIDSAVLKKVFEPFFSTKNKSGNGIGLATVLQIIKKTDGHIFVETQANVGTTFHIYLKQIETTCVSDLEINKTSPKKNPDNNKDCCIYVVENEDSVRISNLLVLKKAGYNVDSAKNAEDALLILQKEQKKYDVLLTDIFLNDMNGIDLAEEAKEYLPDIRIIFTSGYTKDTLPDMGISSSTFLCKPYSISDLLETIEASLIKK